jgi:hypothetical protein
MAKITFDSDPVFVDWQGVVVGNVESIILYFANPGGYTIVNVGDGAQDVTLTNPVDLSGSTWTFSVFPSAGDPATFEGSVDTANAATGILTLTMSKTQTALLTTPRFMWQLVENAATTPTTVVLGGMYVIKGAA